MQLGDEVFLHDTEASVPHYGLPRFAPLRKLVAKAAEHEGVFGWNERRGLAIPAGGAGQPRLAVHVKKTKDLATRVVEDAGLLFRFDDDGGGGFGFAALKQKLGTVPFAQTGVASLLVGSLPEGSDWFWAERYDSGVSLKIKLYVQDEDGDPTTCVAWGRAPLPAPQTPPQRPAGSPTQTHTEDSDEEVDKDSGVPGILVRLADLRFKVCAALFALNDGAHDVGTAREDLFAPLEAMNVTNAREMTQAARVAKFDRYVRHNGQSGADARLSLTETGASLIREAYRAVDDDTADLEKMTRTIKRLAGTAPASPEPPPSKRPRTEAPPAAAPAAATPVEADSFDALGQRLEAMAARFETDLNVDLLGEEFGRLAAEFFKEHGAPPDAAKSAELVEAARKELAGQVVVGAGKVRLSEVLGLVERVKAAKTLAEDVAALEARMQSRE